MNHRLHRERDRRRKRNRHFFVATTFGVAILASPAWAQAQAANPLDANAPVTSTTYKSPLADFRAFDPDEAMHSWVDANRRVEEIGGWRTYLRQANPPKKSIKKAPTKPTPEKPVTQAAVKETEQTEPAITIQSESKQQPTAELSEPIKAPPQVAAVASKQKDENARPPVTGVPTLAEGGKNQQDEIQLSWPDLPDRFSRGECPRVLTGLRLPVNPRVIALSKKTEQLLLRVAKCFRTRSYIVGGHTDGRGPLGANRALSQSRADAVRTFLLANGVSPTRITSRGYGETRPLDTNRTKRGRARNRRIDFTLDR